MEIEDKKLFQQLETSTFPDLAYETKLRGMLEGLNKPQDLKREQLRFSSATRNIPPENVESLLSLEKINKLYIFKKPRSIFTIETISSRQDQITIIFPSGKIENFSPTLSQGESENTYINTYQLDTSCIGVSIPKSCTVVKVISANLSETIKNVVKIRKELEEKKSIIDQARDETNLLESKIETQKRRSENLSAEHRNTEKNLEQLRQLLIEKEKEISLAETQKQRVIEDRLSLENSLDSIKSDIEVEKKNKENVESDLNAAKNELANLQTSANKIKTEISDLEQKKNLFDNELSGFNVEGKSQVNIYLCITAIILTMLLLATGFIIFSGIDLINNNYSMNMIDVLISRVPLTVGMSLIISMGFALSYFMINQSIRINSERMKFMQASIIAKDMWTASELTKDISPLERERLRQQAKIQLIGKIFEESSHSKHDHKIIDVLVERLLKKE